MKVQSLLFVFACCVVDTALLIAEPPLATPELAPDIAEGLQIQWARYLELKPGIIDDGENILVLIPPGSFTMGSPSSEEGHRKDEQLHDVTITNPFFIGSFEVTVGQFKEFVTKTGYESEAESDGRGGWGYDKRRGTVGLTGSQYTWRNPGYAQNDSHPVVNVSYKDALAFCKWCTQMEGVKYRLPTEAEWEYACRAGNRGMFSGGRPRDVGNMSDHSLSQESPVADRWAHGWDDGFAFTAPVGRFKPNAWSIHDMHGNVWEWVSDEYSSEYYSDSPLKNPTGPYRGEYQMFRGGGWFNPSSICRSANRNVLTAADRTNLIGFRVVREVE